MNEYLKSRNALEHKYEQIRFGKINNAQIMEEKLKPLITPLTSIKTSILPYNQKILELPPMKDKTLLGDIAIEYLSNVMNPDIHTDKSFGLVSRGNKFYIGNRVIEIHGNDIIFPDTHELYEGTRGLWELLTLRDPDNTVYDDNDWENYKKIVLSSAVYKQNNDPENKKIKSSTGNKYKTIIRPILLQSGVLKEKVTDSEGDIQGQGLNKIYTKVPKEYVYWNSIDELLDRLYILWGEIKSGNTNPSLINEIVNILQEFKEL